MKKIIAGMLSVIICFSLLAVNASASTDKIMIPYAITAPNIDGNGNDDIWKDAYKETLNPLVAAKAGNFVQEKGNTSGAASADISVLWNEKGLYFKFVVDDPTQSFALDLPNNQLNSMDGVQFVIDPLYKRFSSVNNCAFCFTFVPYTCPRESGVGQVPTGPCSWFEHWQWVGITSSIGVEMACKLVSRPDDNNDGLDQVILVSGYTIEAFIPVEALNLNEKIPQFKEHTVIGIGFMLLDYLYDDEKFKDNGGFENGGTDSFQVIYNFCMDFSSTKSDLGRPARYNTAVLVKNNDLPLPSNIPYDALKNAIQLAEDYIKNKDKYTDASITVLQAAIDDAKKLTENATEEDCTNAQEKMGIATNGLLLKSENTLANQVRRAQFLVNQYVTETPPYTVESWKIFTDALAAAKAILNKEGFNEGLEEVKTAKKALEEARAELVESDGAEMVDVTELEKIIDAVKKVNPDDFTEASYRALQIAFANAETVYANANTATKDEVDAATQGLKDANCNLVRKDADSNSVNGPISWLSILFIIAGVIAIAAAVLLVFKKKKDIQPNMFDSETVTETTKKEAMEFSEEDQGENEDK